MKSYPATLTITRIGIAHTVVTTIEAGTFNAAVREAGRLASGDDLKVADSVQIIVRRPENGRLR